MALITQQELLQRLDDLVVRTERGNAVVLRNPRELPRRLRVLLMAVDGSHTVQLYVQTLKGFGDISELLIELMALGFVRLQNPNEQANPIQHSQEYEDLNRLFDDSRFSSEHTADVMYGATAPGSFDEMLRVARVEVPDFVPPPPSPPPAPVSPQAQKAQIESLFKLLEAVRGERRNLKHQLAKMNRIKAAAINLDKENQRLFSYVFILSTVCIAVAVAGLIFWLRR